MPKDRPIEDSDVVSPGPLGPLSATEPQPDLLENLWAWELEPVAFEFDWKGRTWTGLVDVQDPPASLFDMVTLATEPVYTKKARAKRDVKVVAGMIEFLAAVILEWNYVDRRGQPVDVTIPVLASLPSSLLGETFNAVAGIFQSAPNT